MSENLSYTVRSKFKGCSFNIDKLQSYQRKNVLIVLNNYNLIIIRLALTLLELVHPTALIGNTCNKD